MGYYKSSICSRHSNQFGVLPLFSSSFGVLMTKSYKLSWSLVVNEEMKAHCPELAPNLSLYLVLEKTLESPLDCKEIQPVHPKGNQSWIFIGRTDATAEIPIFWPPDSKNWLFWKDSDAGKDWSWEEKGTTEDEMVGWHHQLNGHEFESTLGAGDGQWGLACCSPWGHKESDTTEWLNWTELVSITLHWIGASIYLNWSLGSDSWDSRVGLKLVGEKETQRH